MNRTVIYGASDDLLEIGGDLSEEFSSSQDEPQIVGLSNGVVLRITCDDEGIWRITPLKGGDHVAVVFARGEDDGADEDDCPGYSDKAVITDSLSWAVVGTEWVHA